MQDHRCDYLDCPHLLIKKLNPNAIIPTRGSAEAAGLDLYALEYAYIDAGKVTVVKTGIALSIPKGWYGAVCSRSGNVAKLGLVVANQPGIIDSDYRGEVCVLLTSLYGICTVKPGQRIAQLIIQPYSNINSIEVTELNSTDRDSNGFGSTGS